jgi:polar amino acid transport system substrate-binding protein
LKYLSFIILTVIFLFSAEAKEPNLKVVSEHWPPFIIQKSAANSFVSGIVTDNVRDILAHTNLSYQIETYPWARSYHLAKTKPNVLIYSIYKTKQRGPNFEWFCPIYKRTPINLYKLKSNASNASSLDSLKSSVVGVLRDDNSHNFMLNSGFKDGVNLAVSASEEVNIKKLLKGRIDAIIQSREALIYRLKGSGYNIENFTEGLQIHQDFDSEHCMALSKDSSPDVILAVDQAFNKWLKNK